VVTYRGVLLTSVPRNRDRLKRATTAVPPAGGVAAADWPARRADGPKTELTRHLGLRHAGRVLAARPPREGIHRISAIGRLSVRYWNPSAWAPLVFTHTTLRLLCPPLSQTCRSWVSTMGRPKVIGPATFPVAGFNNYPPARPTEVQVSLRRPRSPYSNLEQRTRAGAPRGPNGRGTLYLPLPDNHPGHQPSRGPRSAVASPGPAGRWTGRGPVLLPAEKTKPTSGSGLAAAPAGLVGEAW